MSTRKVEKIIVYFDGFNFYHALSDLKKDHLKWVNLWRLSEYLVRPKSQRLVAVKYFSAFANQFSNTPSVDKLLRHRAYVAALEAKGVECLMGNFAKRDHHYSGKGYKARWRRYEEKQTDVGIAVHLINDAHKNAFDTALVVSVDTDLLPAFKMVQSEFPAKSIVCVAPPSRNHHRDIQANVSSIAKIKVSQVERSLFGVFVQKNGAVVARRPRPYKPPTEDQNSN